MEINYKTQFNVGQHLYSLKGSSIEEWTILRLKLSYEECEGGCGVEEFYTIATKDKTKVIDIDTMEDEYFSSKKELIQYIIDVNLTDNEETE